VHTEDHLRGRAFLPLAGRVGSISRVYVELQRQIVEARLRGLIHSLDERPQRRKSTIAFAEEPLSGAQLQVTRGDIVEEGDAENIVGKVLVRNDILLSHGSS